MRFAPLSLRWKMTLAALAPFAIILVLVSFAAFWLINAWIVGETQKRVRNDLNAARTVLSHESSRVRDIVRFTANTAGVLETLSSGNSDTVKDELRKVYEREGLDLLTLIDAEGRVVLRGAAPESGADVPPFPFLRQALEGNDFSGTVVMAEAEMAREGETLAERARIHVRPPIPPGRDPVETRGMFLLAASAVRNEWGQVVGCLYGGVLLNGNLPLVDRIQEIVYSEETFHGIDTGSATIFLEDLRIATTVLLKNGERAVGTRVSSEVADAVLKQEQTWLARARVVDDWYLTAYEPIPGSGGAPIGAFYVGLLEAPFDLLKLKASLALLALLVLGCGIGYMVARDAAVRISRPILELDAGARLIASGRRDIRLPVFAADEVGRLTDTFNHMAAALRRHEEELNELNRDLERKVTERTALLEEKSLELLRTQQELLRAEKLAAIGELASGVAHEINNPAAIIRGNVEILLNELPPDHPAREEAGEVLRQTERISLITRNMLSFAREQAVLSQKVDINPLLEEILAQAGHQVPAEQVTVVRRLASDLPSIEGDRERLRQVFTNIVINALQAMEGEGTLTVESRLYAETVEIAVADTGPGIPEGAGEKIFNPFFTTRPHGTGLGLSVTYGIVKAHRGSIAIEKSTPEGAVFRVKLPLLQGEGLQGERIIGN
jgi:signal transduction histidine kinase